MRRIRPRTSPLPQSLSSLSPPYTWKCMNNCRLKLLSNPHNSRCSIKYLHISSYRNYQPHNCGNNDNVIHSGKMIFKNQKYQYNDNNINNKINNNNQGKSFYHSKKNVIAAESKDDNSWNESPHYLHTFKEKLMTNTTAGTFIDKLTLNSEKDCSNRHEYNHNHECEHDHEHEHSRINCNEINKTTKNIESNKKHENENTITMTKHQHQHHSCQDHYLSQRLPLPPPLPQPKFSYHRRILPPSMTQFSSPKGRNLFLQSLSTGNANAYFPLAEQFLNQSDPAYCGITSLIMVFNAMGLDPNIRWKGGWRWFGSEDMILDTCCIDKERVLRAGILLEEFASLAKCQGVDVIMKRPFPLSSGDIASGGDHDDAESDNTKHEKVSNKYYSLTTFRHDLMTMVRNPPIFSMDENDYEYDSNREDSNKPTLQHDTYDHGGDDYDDHDGAERIRQKLGGFMVVSYSRQSLGQTGEGHFSPIAAYHPPTDQCLILDVARFKYAPYWLPVPLLYEAMKPKDPMTNQSRGWFLMYPPNHDNSCNTDTILSKHANHAHVTRNINTNLNAHFDIMDNQSTIQSSTVNRTTQSSTILDGQQDTVNNYVVIETTEDRVQNQYSDSATKTTTTINKNNNKKKMPLHFKGVKTIDEKERLAESVPLAGVDSHKRNVCPVTLHKKS